MQENNGKDWDDLTHTFNMIELKEDFSVTMVIEDITQTLYYYY